MSAVVFDAVDDALRTQGYAVLPGGDAAALDALVGALGAVVGEEPIRLREGAHAYVAKPGRVPLHTDHPQVDLIAWRCVAQDPNDGASWLLDARPVLDALPAAVREALRATRLECPRLAGGPPTCAHPVLWGQRSSLFCSPWLRAVGGDPASQRALDTLREHLSDAARDGIISVRLAPGDTLVVDNHRVLHGRGPIAPDSPRHLRRQWIQRHGVKDRPGMHRTSTAA